MANKVYSTIIEELRHAQNRLEYMVNHPDTTTLMDVVYALGNINGLYIARDSINSPDFANMTFEDIKQYKLRKDVCKQHPLFDWDDLLEGYWNYPDKDAQETKNGGKIK